MLLARRQGASWDSPPPRAERFGQLSTGPASARARLGSRQLLAISLLDATVKVFYIDTLKFFLSLYGHKLPVLSMDISSDSALLITASADKTVKIWGLDFGDCHRSLLAHADSVMAVRFVPKTHYFFSASKDKVVKYWDGDKVRPPPPRAAGAVRARRLTRAPSGSGACGVSRTV